MSRALDKDVVASLKAVKPLAAYQAISELLLASPNGGLLELEILPKTHQLPEGQFVLQDGCAAGVSKLGLVQAFLVARQMLRGHLDEAAPQSVDELFSVTAVMLFMDPENLTAANTRKRLLQSRITAEPEKTYVILQTEKLFLDSLLTSRLHRHTKSPTLWGHRRWLLQLFVAEGFPVDVLADITTVVFVAGERHPRNYYAWCHARYLVGLETGDSNDRVVTAVKQWSFKHHTDISGWSFLYFLLGSKASSGTAAGCSTLIEVVELASSLHLANESVWVFLRTLAASGLVGEEEYFWFLSAGQALLETSRAPTDQRVLRSAMQWCETYRVEA
ncbi:hypothetical protein B0T25DRAFT_305479 [Lasiosphaeria hispida]|uniref:Protein prenyltransferase n=1 Tax=Lasiosphaeria hispida TaxID=260671 RepID=A0AAJ0H8G5_9PEZI|nr:hypothetical protein B0T25DRAFT_305479 [Lasiosphaeria hispida]